jgi:hypothetical protein
MAYDAARYLGYLPAQLEMTVEPANNIVTAIYKGINGVLSVLPAPIYAEHPLAIQALVPSAATPVEANSLPQASLAVAGGISVKSVDPVEKKLDTTDSAVSSAPDSGADASVSNPAKSGNKVNPGDKFDNGAKGETGKDNGARVSTAGGDKVTSVGDTPVAASPQHGETGGAVASGAGGSGAAAA